MEHFSKKKLRVDRNKFHLVYSIMRTIKYSPQDVSTIAIWEVKTQYKAGHKQGGNSKVEDMKQITGNSLVLQRKFGQQRHEQFLHPLSNIY